MTRVVGVVPAAGVGSRMWPYRAPKELLQVGYANVPGVPTGPMGGGPEGLGGGEIQRLIPRAAIEHTLQAMRRGGIDSAFVVVSASKWEIARYLGCGEHLAMTLAYLCQDEPQGMPHAINLVRPFAAGATVCLGMPDTMVEPLDCYEALLAAHHAWRADLTLGVFDTDEPHCLAPVVLDPRTLRVLDIVDKPEVPPVANTWGIAAWAPSFTDLLHDFVVARGEPGAELLLSEAFLAAAHAGLRVFGLPFEAGAYHDIGSPANLIRARARWEASQHQPAGR
jgi:glucose-1-phosphate thymidylyltransferase